MMRAGTRDFPLSVTACTAPIVPWIMATPETRLPDDDADRRRQPQRRRPRRRRLLLRARDRPEPRSSGAARSPGWAPAATPSSSWSRRPTRRRGPREPRASSTWRSSCRTGRRWPTRCAGSRRPTGGFTGASDHLVSEALYLRDPEGNGIEIYRDRPREEWPTSDGQLQMDSLAARPGRPARPSEAGRRRARCPAATTDGPRPPQRRRPRRPRSSSTRARAGFDVTVRGYPGALFVSAGGYHHHVGLNTWSGEGAPAPPDGARGLRHFELVRCPTPAAVDTRGRGARRGRPRDRSTTACSSATRPATRSCLRAA